jgi:thymidylate synthase (FAD)
MRVDLHKTQLMEKYEEPIPVLDHGFVKLIEMWGSEEQIIEAARMSTNKGFQGWGEVRCSCGVSSTTGRLPHTHCPTERGGAHVAIEDAKPGDEKLLRYLWEHKHHCYDAATEVLTRRGFVTWPDVRKDDLLGCWDPVAESLVYEAPLQLVADPFKGNMYRVDHGGVDLLVTPGHRMYVQTKVSVVGENRQVWSPWRLETVEELGFRSMVRYRKHARRKRSYVDLSEWFPQHDDSRELLRLIGFFLGDGFAGRDDGTVRNSIQFHLRKKRKIAYLKEVCAGVGWACDELSSCVVRADGLTSAFRRWFYTPDGDKCIPDFLMDLGADDAAALLDGLRNSDGSEKRGAWEYTTMSAPLADAVQRIAIHAGECVQVGRSDVGLYRMMFLSRMTEPVINQSRVNTSWVPYEGTVYCANTRTGVLVVRRGGKVVLSGNTPFEMAGITVEVQAPIFVFREWHRHRVPFGYNEMSARYTPLPDVNYVPTVERLTVNATGSNKQANRIHGARELDAVSAEAYRRKLVARYAQLEDDYQSALSDGVPKELARVILPVGRYSRMRATSNLRGWVAFLALRTDEAAQFEIRQFALVVQRILSDAFPRTLGLFAQGRVS